MKTITMHECVKFSFPIISDLVDRRILQLTECIWPHFKDDETKNLTFNLSEFGKTKLEIMRVDGKDAKSSYDPNLNQIKFIDKGGLAHELTHCFFCEIYSSYCLTQYIGRKCKSCGKKVSINTYFESMESNSDKIIGYLYLAAEDELRAKLTGFSVRSEKSNNDDLEFKTIVAKLYCEMVEFQFNENDYEEAKIKLSQIYRFDELNRYLKDKSATEINNFINVQGSRFTESYRILSDLNFLDVEIHI